MEPERICRKCGEPKPLKEFNKQQGLESGFTLVCKLCKNKSAREKYRRAKKIIASKVDFDDFAHLRKAKEVFNPRIHSTDTESCQLFK